MTESVFRTAEHTNFAIAMCLNVLALSLIFTKSRKEISQYRKLLVIFLTTGMLIMHLISNPTCVVRENAFIMYGSGWITDMRFMALYCGVASMSFLILAMHFLYRAMVLSSKTYSIVEISTKNIVQIVLILLFELIVSTVICAVFLCYKPEYAPTMFRLTKDLDDFPTSDLDTRLMMFLGTVDNEMNLPPFFAIVCIMLLCGVSLSIIVWSSVRIIGVLNDKQHRSSAWRKYNYQLFVALYLQFIGPLIFLYLPCISFLLLPFVPGQRFYSPPWLLPLLYSSYPIGMLNLLRMAVFLRPLDDNSTTTMSTGTERNNNR